MVEIQHLSSQSFLKKFSFYQHLILPLERDSIRRLASTSSLTIIEALEDQRPVGLLVADEMSRWTVWISSLVVKEKWRNRGIGFALFQFFQDHALYEKKYAEIGVNYIAGTSAAAAMEKILSRLEWPLPRRIGLRCHFIAKEFHPDWYEKYLQRPLPDDFKIFPWKEVSLEEKEIIEMRERQGRFTHALSPFNEETKMELLNSLGLRYKEDIVGWMVTHRYDPETIDYSSLYVEKEFYRKGYAIDLLAQAIHLQKESTVPKATLEVNFSKIDHSWLIFLKKRLIPYSTQVEHLKQARYIFSPNTRKFNF